MDLTVDFDEKDVLEKNLQYLTNTLEVGIDLVQHHSVIKHHVEVADRSSLLYPRPEGCEIEAHR